VTCGTDGDGDPSDGYMLIGPLRGRGNRGNLSVGKRGHGSISKGPWFDGKHQGMGVGVWKCKPSPKEIWVGKKTAQKNLAELIGIGPQKM